MTDYAFVVRMVRLAATRKQPIGENDVDLIADVLETLLRERDDWKQNYDALSKALVGETGASAILTAETLVRERDETREALKEVSVRVFFEEQFLTHYADNAFAGKVETCGREFGRSVWGSFKKLRDLLKRYGVEVPPLKMTDMETRRQDFVSETTRLRKVIERLGSMEAFGTGFYLGKDDNGNWQHPACKELDLRIDYARENIGEGE